MGTPYIGEIRMFAGNFAPNGWAFCQGQLLPISENEALFQLIGTTYGGDGETTFAVPDLRSRIPIHQGNGFLLAEMGGAEEITLTTSQIAAHNHAFLASSNFGTVPDPQGNVLARSTAVDLYIEAVGDSNLTPRALEPVGGSQAHDNMQPFLCLNFIISLFGTFPSPT